jgi:crotonobetainyl-CoA:carnitine CoA-transferase CaiB-like acyl-CoA transferase
MRGDAMDGEPAMKSFKDGPLTGVRVLDLTSVIMGPMATHILADLGADVVKVESPEGDSFRNYRPLRHDGMAGSVLNLHRNKRSILLDLKQPDARAALERLIATSDVLMHTMRPAAIARLGYGYEQVRAIRPDIVYCGAYGFGADGPYADKAAYDDLIQAGSGLAALNARVGGRPSYVPTVLCDKLAGQAMAYAVAAALYQRAAGGGGQAIEVPMFETAIEFMLIEHMFGFAFEPPLDVPGFPRVLNPRRRPYRTSDGYACILPYSDRNWRDFFDFTGRRELEGDSRFLTLHERVVNISELYVIVEEEAAKRTTAEWVAFCDRVSIPCMPVMALEDLPDDPHVAAVGLFGSAVHPTEGSYRTVRRPVSFSGSRFSIRRHAPRLGQDTLEVLREAGIDEERIARITGEAGLRARSQEKESTA